jgi:hypothetical protein
VLEAVKESTYIKFILIHFICSSLDFSSLNGMPYDERAKRN